jgi:hypothetical protein
MKLTKGILATVMMVGGAWAQNPNIINNVQNQMTAVQQKQTADSNAALGIQSTFSSNGPATKPSPAASAPAVKSASVKTVNPATAKTASSATAKVANTPATNKVSVESSKNKLEQVKVIHRADDVQIEMATREAVTPTVDKLTSPDRVVVELPATAMATPKSKIAVDASGIKGVRIGVNGKTPPTTSVVVDLDHAISYEISAGPSNKFVLTLHVQGATQSAVVAKKNSAEPAMAKSQPVQKASAKPVIVASPAAPKTVAAKPITAKPIIAAKVQIPAQDSKPPVVAAAPKVAISAKIAAPAPAAAQKASVAPKAASVPPAPKVAIAAKAEAAKAPSAATKPAKVTIAASKEEPKAATAQAAKSTTDDKLAPIATAADDSKAPKPEDKKWAMTGKRDPFFSPVVQQATGSGCSTGKKCLEIGQINVRGIVKSEGGFIAVVTNSLNKAYFLHENDPVFNGYVLRITGDSVVFQETYQDKFGKPLTREVTKTVVAPAV